MGPPSVRYFQDRLLLRRRGAPFVTILVARQLFKASEARLDMDQVYRLGFLDSRMSPLVKHMIRVEESDTNIDVEQGSHSDSFFIHQPANFFDCNHFFA